MKDRAGESLKTANKLNFKTNNQRVREFIGSRDDSIDIFRFKSRSSAIAITAKGLSRKEDVTLYQVDQKLSKTLKKIGKRDFGTLRPKQQQKLLSDIDLTSDRQGKKTTYSTEADNGVYFLVVSSKARNPGKYTLKFSASPLDATPGTEDGSVDGGTDGNTTDGGSSGTIDDGTGVTDGNTGDTDGGTDGGTGGTDSGGTDGGGTDSGSTDGGGTDSGGTDSGSTDGGSTDGGSTDGGSTDGGTGSDDAIDAWTRQFGSSQNDYGYGVAVDAAGNVYIAGTTAGDLFGINGGDQDNFVTKYDATGAVLWSRQFSFDDSNPAYSDTIFDIEVDSAGNYYVAGITINIPENFSSTSISDIEALDADGFVAKYDQDGNELWSQVIETDQDTRNYTVTVSIFTTDLDIHKFDAASSLAIAPDGSVYVGGFVEAIPSVSVELFSQQIVLESNPSQGFIAKFDGNSGTQAWLTPLGGSDSDAITDLTIDDNGKIHITGIQSATLTPVDTSAADFSAALSDPFEGGDVLVAQYQENTGGTGVDELWTQTLASTDNQQDYGRGIALDPSGNVYVTGDTRGSLPGQTATGEGDGFVAQYTTAGTLQWVKQFGTAAKEQAQAIAIDSTGKIYVSGETAGSLYGTNAGSDDIWIATYDSNGTVTNSTQIGTAIAEEIYRATVDASDNLYFVGQTFGDLENSGAHQGLFDVVVLKKSSVQ